VAVNKNKKVKNIMKKIKIILKESKNRKRFPLQDKKGTKKLAKAKVINAVQSGNWPFSVNHDISGVIKYSGDSFFYNIVVDGERFVGEAQNGGNGINFGDMGPASMQISSKHETFPRDIHEPAMQYAWANGDIRVFEI